MPVVPSRRPTRGALLRTLLPLLLGVGVLALAACGSSSSGSSLSASSDDARDTARVKLQQCLREQGVDVPDTPGGGGGGGAVTRLSATDRTKLQQALQGACKQYANGAFGQISDEQRQEFQDAFTKFSACMRKQGIDVPTPQPGSGSGPPAGGGFDRSDPKVQAAAKACQSLLPQRGPGGPGGN